MGYFARSLKKSDRYYTAWADYRRRQRFVWFAGSLAVLVILVGMWLAVRFDSELVVLAAALTSFSLFAFAVWRHAMWRCPKCAKTYGWTWYMTNPFADYCVHCRLQKYAPCDPSVQQWERIDLT